MGQWYRGDQGRLGGRAVAVSGHQGLMKETLISLEKGAARNRMQNLLLRRDHRKTKFGNKIIPSKGVATAINKKSNSKFCPKKQTENRRNTQAALAPTRCGPVEACGKMDSNAP